MRQASPERTSDLAKLQARDVLAELHMKGIRLKPFAIRCRPRQRTADRPFLRLGYPEGTVRLNFDLRKILCQIAFQYESKALFIVHVGDRPVENPDSISKLGCH